MNITLQSRYISFANHITSHVTKKRKEKISRKVQQHSNVYIYILIIVICLLIIVLYIFNHKHPSTWLQSPVSRNTTRAPTSPLIWISYAPILLQVYRSLIKYFLRKMLIFSYKYSILIVRLNIKDYKIVALIWFTLNSYYLTN